MPIDQGTEAVEITTQERTWRTNIETPYGGETVITVFREVIKTDAKGEIIARENRGATTLADGSLSALAAQVDVVADAERSVSIAEAAKSAAAELAAVPSS